jgi:alpha-glucosidase (family GH31 glycosyl hydrolase)
VSKYTLRFLAPNAVLVSHSTADRPWLHDILTPNVAHSPAVSELQILEQDSCLVALSPKGEEFFRELYPPQTGLRSGTPFLSADIPKAEIRLGIRKVDDGVRLAFAITPGERFYGWGEQFNTFQRESGQVRLRIRDAIAPLQARGETYSGIPLYLSSRGYALLLLNSHTSRWRIQPQRGMLEVEADGPPADYLLIYGPSFKRIIETYTLLSGRPPLPPRWAFGLWVTSYPQGSQQGVLEHAHQHRQRNLPLDAVILDYHWEERFHNFKWRRSLIPDPAGLIADLDKIGMRLGLIQTPFINARNRPFQKWLLRHLAHNLPPGLENDDERAIPEYEQAKSAGLLAHTDAKWWFGAGGMPDFANPQAAAWWNRLMRPLYDQGVTFFKNDDGEYLPEDASSPALGIDGREYHNLYGFYYGKALYEGMSASENKPSRRALIYARSTWAGSQRYPALFLGDQKPTAQGLRNTLRAGLNLSLQGFAYWTADVFGLDGKTTLETHMRYAQWALLVPIARYFWRPPAIDDTRFPWSHGPQAEANFRRYSELRYRLLPYLYSLAWQSWQEGLPLLRPLVLEFQQDARLTAVYDQALLGPNLMLCPVIDPGVLSRRILLPEGTWHDFWSSQSWQGPAEIDYPAPLDCLPLLVRGGAVLPMGPVLQHIPDDHRFSEIEIHLWPPYPASGFLYDDDGCTTAYQQGQYSLVQITAESSASGPAKSLLHVRLLAATGSPPVQLGAGKYTLILHRCEPAQAVLINGLPDANWSYAEELRELKIQFAFSHDQETLIEVRF